jgi:hypothetical protein
MTPPHGRRPLPGPATKPATSDAAAFGKPCKAAGAAASRPAGARVTQPAASDSIQRHMARMGQTVFGFSEPSEQRKS